MEKRYCCELSKTPKVKTVIEGFPGFGLVSTIETGERNDSDSGHLAGRRHYYPTEAARLFTALPAIHVPETGDNPHRITVADAAEGLRIVRAGDGYTKLTE